MVPVAVVGLPSSALDEGLEIVSVNVSSSSSRSSWAVAMLMVSEVSPAAMVRVAALAAVKSSDEAVSPASIEVLYCTVRSDAVAWFRLTVNARLVPSAPEAPAMLTCGLPSLSRMVPVADVTVPRLALDEGLDRVTVKVSSSSAVVSSAVATVKVARVSPAGMVSVCALAAVKSSADAVSDVAIEVLYCTVAAPGRANSSETVKVTFPPSRTDPPVMLSSGVVPLA